LPESEGQLKRIYVVGVFALYAGPNAESSGTVGATFQLVSDRDIIFRQDLINGRHYDDAANAPSVCRICGDGTSIETVGMVEIDGNQVRVDTLTIDIPSDTRARKAVLRDLSSPASFIVFDIFFEFQEVASCPFKRKSGGVSLAELGAALRVGDRLKFSRALDQLDAGLDESDDLEEARGQALTFLAVVIAATLENGASRSSHKALLQTSREIDQLDSRAAIRDLTRARVLEVTDNLFAPSENPSDRLVDRALAIVERHYAKDLTDTMISAQLGLSTSHFRFLFRQATGQPFHKYVVALRLEKAKQMLIEQEVPISQVATAVGFTGLSHFSRAFAQRFSASPSQVRRSLN
jgi:AraC-like DNA-binding protein